ncbi:hypothetical protein SAMN05192529_1172 [Arachidicoccus rhizosphaerae]|uniref:ABC transporter ATPase n=1 Tax=Arachidicoccus rhizosphaerae TaxID=551991 RepID=A0A1H4AWV8_9BACT|nr:hypothetical protein [Arachidicoccus rhizosphaerae]SEA40371.1 hypothetical protein SAMN05192529_1172 [Arachidicoccus rhizosphaerae]
MDLDYQKHIPVEFAAGSKVWIYQASRRLGMAEALELESDIQAFSADWNTHGRANTSYINLFFGQFLVIMADEAQGPVSGCSTDSSIRFVKQLEKKFGVQFFDRQLLAFIIKDEIQVLPLNQLDYAISQGFLNKETLYFNNLVSSKKDLLEKWLVPIKDSWLAGRLELN